jgi:hypothetical protein
LQQLSQGALKELQNKDTSTEKYDHRRYAHIHQSWSIRRDGTFGRRDGLHSRLDCKFSRVTELLVKLLQQRVVDGHEIKRIVESWFGGGISAAGFG